MTLMTVCNNPARMEDVEHGHVEEHETRIEDVQVHLFSKEESITALDVFDNTEDRSDHDKDTRDVERV